MRRKQKEVRKKVKGKSGGSSTVEEAGGTVEVMTYFTKKGAFQMTSSGFHRFVAGVKGPVYFDRLTIIPDPPTLGETLDKFYGTGMD